MDKAIEMVKLPPYRIWLIADYKPNESWYIFTGHHAAGDGVQIFSVMQALTTNKDFS